MTDTVEILPGTSDRDASVLRNMAEAGVPTSVAVQGDYFGFDYTKRIIFPDGVSYMDHKVLNEGARRKYLSKTNKDVRIQSATKDAFLKMQQGEDRIELLKVAIVGWNLVRNGTPVRFESTALDNFFQIADPKLVDFIYKEVTKANPWLLGEMTSKDIQKEIDNLTEMLAVKVAEEEGKASS